MNTLLGFIWFGLAIFYAWRRNDKYFLAALIISNIYFATN